MQSTLHCILYPFSSVLNEILKCTLVIFTLIERKWGMHYADQSVLSHNDRLMRLFTPHHPETRIQQGGILSWLSWSGDWHLQDTFSLSRNHKGRDSERATNQRADTELLANERPELRVFCTGTSPSTREICFLKTQLIGDVFENMLSKFNQNQIFTFKKRGLLNVSLFMWLISVLSNWYLRSQIRTKRVGCEDFELTERSREV